MPLLGISGPAGSGKDTVADYIVQTHRGVKVALADAIKRWGAEVYGFSDEQLWGPSSARNRPDERYPRDHTFAENGQCVCCGGKRGEELGQCFLNARLFLQRAGTECGRYCYPNTWIDKVIEISEQLLSNTRLMYTAQGGLMSRKATQGDGAPKGELQYVVVSDVRFQNELDAIRKAGGKLLRVIPTGWKPVPSSEAWRQHASEAEQATIPNEAFDIVVENAKIEFSSLYESVEIALRDLT